MKNWHKTFAIQTDNRIYGLDILRCLAILLVVYLHGYPIISDKIDRTTYFRFEFFDGVGMFFVLSGFLIGTILIRSYEREGLTYKSLLSFWIRRWFRTLPNYFLILFAFLFIQNKLLHQPFFDIRYLFFFQNFNQPVPTFFPESWSLSVEEWFYLLTPAFLFLLANVFKFLKKKHILLVIIVLIILISTVIRLRRTQFFGNLTANDEWMFKLRFQVVTRLDSIMFGVLGAYIKSYYPGFWKRVTKGAFFTGLFIIVISYLVSSFFKDRFSHYWFYNQVFSFSVDSISILLLLPFLDNLKKGRGILQKGVTFISIISYSMYLLNQTPIRETLLPFLKAHFSLFGDEYISYGTYLFLTIFLSYLLFIFFERPMTRLRDNIKIRKEAPKNIVSV